MLEQTTSILVDSLEPLTIFFLAYTYLLYVAFFKKGKLVGIKSLEELGKILLLFLGLFMLIMPIVFGIIFLSHAMFSTSLPTSLTSDIQSLIVAVIIFVFYPYFMKKDFEQKGKKFDIADWLFMIILIQSLLITFTLISLAYTTFFAPVEIRNFFFGIFLFLTFFFAGSIAYLKVVIIHIFNLRKRSFVNKKSLFGIAIKEVVMSIIFLVFYINFPLT